MRADPNMPGPADLPLRYAGLALLPMAVFVLSEVLLLALAHNAVAFPEQVLDEIAFSDPGEAAARLKLLGMAFLVCLSAIAIVGKFVSDIRSYVPGPARKTLYLACGMVLAVGVVFLVLTYTKQIPLPKERLGAALFDRVFGASDDHSIWSADVYERFIVITHGAVLLALAALVSGGLSCLAALPGRSAEESWKFQSDRLKTYVFISAGFLAISVLYFKSWADYPGFLLTEGDRTAYGSLTNAYTSFVGIEYSLMLAAYALPIAWLQARRADAICLRKLETRSAPGTPAATLAPQLAAVRQQEGLELSLADMLKVVFAIIGPFMTGALTNLVSAVG